MANAEDIELSLPAVKEKFLEAQDKLQRVAQSLQELSSSTTEVREAKASLQQGLADLRETAAANKQLAEELRDLSNQLAQATGLLENLDPQRLLERISSVEEATKVSASNLSEMSSEIEDQITKLQASQIEQIAGVGDKIAAFRLLLWAVLVVQLLLALGVIYQSFSPG